MNYRDSNAGAAVVTDPCVCSCIIKVQAQEVPAMEKELLKVLPNYRPIWACSSTRKGYSGVVALLKQDIVQPIGLHAVTNAAVKVTWWLVWIQLVIGCILVKPMPTPVPSVSDGLIGDLVAWCR